jgi:hypothetical protein
VPAEVCLRCGEPLFSEAVVRNLAYYMTATDMLASRLGAPSKPPAPKSAGVLGGQVTSGQLRELVRQMMLAAAQRLASGRPGAPPAQSPLPDQSPPPAQSVPPPAPRAPQAPEVPQVSQAPQAGPAAAAPSPSPPATPAPAAPAEPGPARPGDPDQPDRQR